MTAVPRSRDQAGVTLVEMLVVLLLSGIIGAILLSVMVNTMRTEQFTSEMQQVMDDGRISLDNVRRELRGGRRVFAGSTPQHLYWWTDQNQDGLQQAEEKIHYCVTALTSTTCETTSQTGAFRLLRWSDDESPSAGRSIAATLTTTDVFSGFAADMTSTRVVHITFDLDVTDAGAGPQTITMEADVRLRNVA